MWYVIDIGPDYYGRIYDVIDEDSYHMRDECFPIVCECYSKEEADQIVSDNIEAIKRRVQ